ncbi:glycosyltransferase [Paucibacter sp. O1-1]|nr:glycosyltransferase [Paucibacter sp. O1-1]MDA3831002.1 glycosyltransferase [Paucibacter sp. O1-1]
MGRLSHYKGHEVLLDALREVPDAALVLVGTGERENNLRTRVAELGLQDRVTLTGYLDDDALARAYADADLFCLPSLDRAEAFGMVLLEAMRAGLPTVASAIPGSGVGFVVEQESTGLLVPPSDPPALAAAIRRVAADPALARQWGSNARERWRTQFTPQAVAQQTQAVYRRVLAR